MKKLLSLVVFMGATLLQTINAQCIKGNCWDGPGAMIYPSGAKYVGNYKKGKIHGKGILYFSNGNKYTGDWVNHYRQGKGVLVYHDGGQYKGDFQQSKFNGKGTFTYKNGDRYEGNWADDLAEGAGTYAFSSGGRYEGNFKRGKFHGDGTMFYKDGGRFVGNWKNNKKHGKGKMISPAGNEHEGNWQLGEMQGAATSSSAIVSTTTNASPATSSDALRDCNTAFCKQGRGEYFYGDGTRYVGSFTNGMPQGEGTTFYNNGDKYVGGWKNHAPDGEGVMYYHHGRVLGAFWKNGKVMEMQHSVGENVEKEYVEVDYDKEVKIWAVVVGVARYTSMQALKYTDDDAYQIYAFLKSPEGGALPDEQIRVLIDEDATRANILRAMRQVYLKADQNDVILFYFSGHGYDGSFVPADFDGFNHLLRHKEVKDILEESKAKHKIVLADACHSGSAQTMAMRSTAYEQTLDKYYNAFEKSRGGLALLMSSKGEEFSLEDGGLRQGIYSHYLIRGLKGEADKNQNKIVTIKELYDFVYKGVRKYTANAQSPTLSGKHDPNMPVAVMR